MEHRHGQNRLIQGKADSEDYHELLGLGSVLAIPQVLTPLFPYAYFLRS